MSRGSRACTLSPNLVDNVSYEERDERHHDPQDRASARSRRLRDRQRVVALVGDPRAHSRTAALASALAVRLAREVDRRVDEPDSAWKLIELSEWTHDRSVHDWLGARAGCRRPRRRVADQAAPASPGFSSRSSTSFPTGRSRARRDPGHGRADAAARCPRRSPAPGAAGAGCVLPDRVALRLESRSPIRARSAARGSRARADAAHLRAPATGSTRRPGSRARR